jgi:hypothetical protein
MTTTTIEQIRELASALRDSGQPAVVQRLAELSLVLAGDHLKLESENHTLKVSLNTVTELCRRRGRLLKDWGYPGD